MWPFSKIKQLEEENKKLKAVINKYESPLSFDAPLSLEGWGQLTKAERIHQLRKLDLVLDMKKKGFWDNANNCAVL